MYYCNYYVRLVFGHFFGNNEGLMRWRFLEFCVFPRSLKEIQIARGLTTSGVFFLTLILSPLENLVLIFLEFLYILLSFSKICLSFLSRLLEFFQKLRFWWKYWRNITNFCMFYANLTAVYTILGKKYLKTI